MQRIVRGHLEALEQSWQEVDLREAPKPPLLGDLNKDRNTFQISPGYFKCSRDHLASFISKGLWESTLNSLPDTTGGGNRAGQIPSTRRILEEHICVSQP